MLSNGGRVVIPKEIRERCELRDGDRFSIEANPTTQEITLRKIGGHGSWFDVYMECPGTFEMPLRRRFSLLKKERAS